MKRINCIVLLLLAVFVFVTSCGDDDDNEVTVKTVLWRNDSCVVKLPAMFGADAVVKSKGVTCDVALNGDEMTIMTGESLGSGRIVVEEPGRKRVAVELEVSLPEKLYFCKSLYKIEPEVDERYAGVINEYILDSSMCGLGFDGDSVYMLNWHEEKIDEGSYDYYRRLLTIYRKDGTSVVLKIESLGDREILSEEDFTDVIRTLVPTASSERYVLRRYYKTFY